MSSTPTNTGQPTFPWFLGSVLVLAGALAVLFHNSFKPELVLFANDAPLGALVAHTDTAHKAFTGHWHPYNWIGFHDPSALPNFTVLFFLLLNSPVWFCKLYAPASLLLLGLSASFLFRRLGFNGWVCAIAGGAAALNADPFSYSAWGLSSHTLAMAATYLAFGAVAGRSEKHFWLRAILCGLAVGMGIMEGYDNGALLSLYVAAFVMFQSWNAGAVSQRLTRGVARVTAVAMASAICSYAALTTLVGTQITGVTSMQQDAESKENRWLMATLASLPKMETLRVIIPGLYGHTIQTQDGGRYWGGIGQSPGNPKTRHSAAGLYAGVLVVLGAVWAFAQACRKRESVFDPDERRAVWFWAGVVGVSLFLTYGRHAPFYQFFYALPYFSTIRNPVKFLHPFGMGLVILFAYGLHGLGRKYLSANQAPATALSDHLRKWWANVQGWDRQWMTGLGAFTGASLLGWLIYQSSRADLVRHLQSAGLPEPEIPLIASHSLSGVGWFVLFVVLSVGAFAIISSGWLAGARSRWGWVLLGLLALTDLTRANRPWLVYYDYKEKYASNPVLEALRPLGHEGRVTARMNPLYGQFLASDPQLQQVLPGLYYDLWLQNHFPYFHIFSTDIIQAPRLPAMDDVFLKTIGPQPKPGGGMDRLDLIPRLWELTNTRLLFGETSFADLLNQQIDPVRRRFQVRQTFSLAPKPGVRPDNVRSVNDLTVQSDPAGHLALIEFTGALPRAKLYSEWQTSTSDTETLAHLTNVSFDAAKTVVLSNPIPISSGTGDTNQSPGTVAITHYEPKQVVLKAQAARDTVLLLNDRFDPDWKVFVDGVEKPVLRCNFIMRGVQLPPGDHTVEFRFATPTGSLYVTLTALGVGVMLCGFLVFSRREEKAAVGTSPKK